MRHTAARTYDNRMVERPDELDTRYQLLAFTRQTYSLGILAVVVNVAVAAVPFLTTPWYVAIPGSLTNLAAAAVVLFVGLPRLRRTQDRMKGTGPQ